jgi:TetR/AcrR family transcriptional regulator, mexJK operon transcriptional repressor
LISNARTQKKQTDILNVATQLFLERGYDAVSLDDILKRVGGSKTTLYSYYGGKEGLFAAMVQRVCRDKISALLALDLAGLDPAEGLTLSGTQFVSMVSDPHGRAVFRAMIAEAPRFPELAAALFASGPEAAIRALRRHIDHWQRKGSLRCGNPEIFATQFLGLMMGNFHLKNLLGLGEQLTERQIKSWVARGVEVFLEGISNPKT